MGETVTAELKFVSPAYHADVRDKLQAEVESLRATLVHIMLDVEDWEAQTSLAGETLFRIQKRVADALSVPSEGADK